MIRYLTGEEKQTSRWLWQEAFPEDSQGFIDYYYKRKTADNRILVKEDEAGRLLSMAHLNPYRVMVKGRLWELNYIVGVATAADSRRQGHMRDMLGKLLLDLHDEGAPFCYLMPASEGIYLPFGFRFVFDQPLWQIKKRLPEETRRLELQLSEEAGTQAGTAAFGSEGEARDCLASWVNRWLDERFQVYAVRDREYMERLEEELDSEAGRVYGWYDGDGELKALQAFWGIGKREQRFLYSMEPDWVEPAKADKTEGKSGSLRPAIMARITNAARMMEAIGLNEEAPCSEMEVLIRIRDKLIPGNQGLWRWKLNGKGSCLIPEPVGLAGGSLFSTEVLDIDVATLTSWLFGYERLENLMGEQEERPPWWCRFAEPIERLFLDEVV